MKSVSAVIFGAATFLNADASRLRIAIVSLQNFPHLFKHSGCWVWIIVFAWRGEMEGFGKLRIQSPLPNWSLKVSWRRSVFFDVAIVGTSICQKAHYAHGAGVGAAMRGVERSNENLARRT